jgi:hypothetical protein
MFPEFTKEAGQVTGLKALIADRPCGKKFLRGGSSEDDALVWSLLERRLPEQLDDSLSQFD